MHFDQERKDFGWFEWIRCATFSDFFSKEWSRRWGHFKLNLTGENMPIYIKHPIRDISPEKLKEHILTHGSIVGIFLTPESNTQYLFDIKNGELRRYPINLITKISSGNYTVFQNDHFEISAMPTLESSPEICPHHSFFTPQEIEMVESAFERESRVSARYFANRFTLFSTEHQQSPLIPNPEYLWFADKPANPGEFVEAKQVSLSTVEGKLGIRWSEMVIGDHTLYDFAIRLRERNTNVTVSHKIKSLA